MCVVVAARGAQGLAVDGDRRQLGGHGGSGAGGEERSDCPVQGVAIEMNEDAAQGVGVGNAHRAGQRSTGKPRARQAYTGASVIHSVTAASERAPSRTLAAAAATSAGSG
jgi:hypothetical protein